MNADRWTRVKVLFEAAHGLPEAEREAFHAREAPEDVELREEIRSLQSQTPEVLPAGAAWLADAWSPDGKWLAGTLFPGGGIVIHSMESRSYTKLTDVGGEPRWRR